MVDVEKVREARLRRMCDRRGFRLDKSRRRDPNAIGFGGFKVVDSRDNVVLGHVGHEFSATLDEIETWLDDTSKA
jgi:hypothetical protein